MKHICSALNRNGEKGFTLVELIVVIAILAILAAVAYPVYTGYIDYTNKGLDRTTVGEVIRAIEMAGYSETVPEGTGFVPVILSNGENGPVIISSDATITGIIKNALTDTYGDLSSIKLAYDGWDSLPSAETFEKIKNGKNVQAYWNTIKDSEGNIKDVTSYSGHVDEIWDIVSNMVEALDKGNLAVDGVEYEGGKRTDYLTEMVAQTQASGNLDSIIDAWKNGNEFTSVTGTGAYLGAKLARNYAFYQFVQEKYSDKIAESETMKKALENVKINGKDYTLALSDNADWTNILSDYKTSGRAAIDAQAYLSLMEAVGSVKAEGVTLEDSDYLKEATKLIGGVEPALAGDSSMLDILSTGSGLLADAGSSKITIYVTIENGMMKVKSAPYGVAPEDADPRDKSDSNVPSEPVAYTENGSIVCCQSAGGDTNWKCTVIMHANEKITVTIKEIPGLDIETTSITGDVTCSQSGMQVTIGSGTSGGTILISWDPSSLGPEFEGMDGSVTIEVVVK